MDPLEVE